MSYLVAFDLATDLQGKGCPMCRAMCRVGEQYLQSLIVSDISDRRVRERIKKSGGLCREHVLTALEVAPRINNRLGMAIVAEWLLEIAASQLQMEIRRTPIHRPRMRRTRRGARASPPCPACQAESVIVDSYVHLLLTDPSRIQHMLAEGHQGICLMHAVRALELTENAADCKLIKTLWSTRSQRLNSLLTEFMRTQSFPQVEAHGDLSTAWIDVAEWVVGASRRRSPPSSSR